MPSNPPNPLPVIAYNDMAQEFEARCADPRFERAMNAFWKAHHNGNQIWGAVQCAIAAAADPQREPIETSIGRVWLEAIMRLHNTVRNGDTDQQSSLVRLTNAIEAAFHEQVEAERKRWENRRDG